MLTIGDKAFYLDGGLPSVERRSKTVRGKGHNAVKAASGSLVELDSFGAFIRRRYRSPGDAFDEMFKTESNDEFGRVYKAQRVDREIFEQRCAAAGFNGRAGLIFDLLKGTDDCIRRSSFKLRLTLSPGLVARTWTGNSSVWPGHGKNVNYSVARFANSAKETDTDRLWKATSYGKLSEKTSSLEDECLSLGSASTTDTSSPGRTLS